MQKELEQLADKLKWLVAMLWNSGELSSDTPDGLLKAVFYYNGLNFVLRGGQEHRDLKVSQFNFRDVPDPDNPGQRITCCEYSEHGSKNRPGGRHQLNLQNKTVVQYARPELGDRCHVYLLELYISKLPVSALQKDTFYMKPRPCIPDSAGDPWYTESPIGHNTLARFLKKIFEGAKIDTTNKSNHSLRATAISRMYQNSIPEKLIMERSGHLSREGLASYERTTPAQQKAVCKTLSTAAETKPLPMDKIKTEDSVSECTTPKTSPLKQEDNNPLDMMKKMQFSHLSGCTFNINFKY